VSDLQVHLDGVDFSGCAIEGSATRRLNRPSQAQIKIPMDCAAGCSGPGQRLKISFDAGASLFFHGMVMDWELDGGEDMGYITMNAMDPMELWLHRVARDGPGSADPGDFSNPGMFTGLDYTPTGPAIIEQMLLQSLDDSDPQFGDGSLFLDLGSFATGGVPLEAGPQDWPMTIAEVVNLLVSTGEVDVIITPSDPGGGIMGTVDVYNGAYGTNLSPYGGTGTVHFEYGTGAKNVRAMRWNQDMSNVCNKLWYYGGPKIATIADPDAIQHWCWNIQGDDCCFTGTDNPPHCVCVSPSSTEMQAAWASIDACRGDSPDPAPGTSRDVYGVRMEVQIFDAASDNCIGKGGFDVERDLYRWNWLAESWARCNPRSLVHITPTRGTAIGAFDIGDIVGVEIGSGVCGGAAGAQRVYEYTVSWGVDGPFELSELQTSSDAGIPS
jgi:hypothetical protein